MQQNRVEEIILLRTSGEKNEHRKTLDLFRVGSEVNYENPNIWKK